DLAKSSFEKGFCLNSEFMECTWFWVYIGQGKSSAQFVRSGGQGGDKVVGGVGLGLKGSDKVLGLELKGASKVVHHGGGWLLGYDLV
ncbi:hypothetical protein Tco_1454273, partial [Tanacetum coccineum]